jgi:hypothetical protein
MSHFTKVRTVIRDQTLLCEALRRQHVAFREGERILIRGYAGNTEYGQVVADTGCAYDIGFQRQADQTMTLCADWWGVQGNSRIRQEDFLREVNRTYAHLAVRKQVEEQGLLIEEEIRLPNGEVELVVAERP